MGSNAAAQRTQQSVDHDAGMVIAERHERAPLRFIHRSHYFPRHRFVTEAVAGTKQNNIQLVDKQRVQLRNSYSLSTKLRYRESHCPRTSVHAEKEREKKNALLRSLTSGYEEPTWYGQINIQFF